MAINSWKRSLAAYLRNPPTAWGCEATTMENIRHSAVATKHTCQWDISPVVLRVLTEGGCVRSGSCWNSARSGTRYAKAWQ